RGVLFDSCMCGAGARRGHSLVMALRAHASEAARRERTHRFETHVPSAHLKPASLVREPPSWVTRSPRCDCAFSSSTTTFVQRASWVDSCAQNQSDDFVDYVCSRGAITATSYARYAHFDRTPFERRAADEAWRTMRRRKRRVPRKARRWCAACRDCSSRCKR